MSMDLLWDLLWNHLHKSLDFLFQFGSSNVIFLPSLFPKTWFLTNSIVTWFNIIMIKNVFFLFQTCLHMINPISVKSCRKGTVNMKRGRIKYPRNICVRSIPYFILSYNLYSLFDFDFFLFSFLISIYFSSNLPKIRQIAHSLAIENTPIFSKQNS
jgi:hypothetical protein